MNELDNLSKDFVEKRPKTKENKVRKDQSKNDAETSSSQKLPSQEKNHRIRPLSYRKTTPNQDQPDINNSEPIDSQLQIDHATQLLNYLQ